MRRLLLAVGLLALTTANLPNAAAYNEYFSAGPSGIDHIVRDTVEGDQAYALRRSADADGDGTVSSDEATAARARPARTIDVARHRACLEGFDMVEAPGFAGGDIMFSETVRMTGPVDRRPMDRTLFVLIWGSGIGLETPVTVHFDRRSELVDLLRCIGHLGDDPYPPGRPDRIEITGGYDSWDIAPPTHPREARALRELMGIDNANIPQYWILADTPEEVEILYANGITYRNALEMQGLQGWIVGHAYLLFGAGGALAVLAAFALLTEVGRWKLSVFSLFTRIEKDEVLAHERRDRLYTYIQENPGQSFSDLRRALGVTSGTLMHHLRVLEAQEFLKVHREGFRTRFYLRGPRVQPEPYLSRTQKQLLDLVQANPGLSQRELAGLLGLPHQSVLYHGRRLVAAGKVALRPDGRRQLYFPGTPTTST